MCQNGKYLTVGDVTGFGEAAKHFIDEQNVKLSNKNHDSETSCVRNIASSLAWLRMQTSFCCSLVVGAVAELMKTVCN